MDLNKIEEKLKDFLKKNGLKLYEINYSKKEGTLSIILDEKFDLNKIEEVSTKISDYMDTLDADMDKYLLDVSTVGAERPIRSLEEAKKAVGEYVYVKTKELELNGTLLSLDDNLVIEYKDKTRVKQATINYKDVKQMRYAIKF